MEKEDKSRGTIIQKIGGIDWEKILAYAGIISFLITFWQGWRDIHKDISDIKERVKSIETQYGHEERLKVLEEKKQ